MRAAIAALGLLAFCVAWSSAVQAGPSLSARQKLIGRVCDLIAAHAEQNGLLGCGQCARMPHRIPQVRPQVDPREHHIGLVPEVLPERHAVSGRAVYTVGVDALELERAEERAEEVADVAPEHTGGRAHVAVAHRRAETRRARDELGFTSAISLAEGLDDLVRWWRAVGQEALVR